MGTTIRTAQGSLFDPAAGLPHGLAFEPEFIDRDEERALIDVIAALPLRDARYKEYTARRRVYAFGSRFDFDAYQLQAQPIGVLQGWQHSVPPVPGLRYSVTMRTVRDGVAA